MTFDYRKECKHCDNPPMKHSDICLECFLEFERIAKEDKEKDEQATPDRQTA